MSAPLSARCFVPVTPPVQAGLPLICLPYAGAGAGAYRDWGARLGPAMNVMAAQLPGRESRFGEAAHTRMTPLVAEVADALIARSLSRYVLFGHSMGALVAFELAREMRRRGELQPALLIVSGHAAPDVERCRRPLHLLPDAQFVDELRRMGGMPEEVLGNAELMTLLLPRLRADFAVCETYSCEPQEPLPCPMLALGGREDELVDPVGLARWRPHTVGPFASEVIDGGHFFLHRPDGELFPVLRAALASVQTTETFHPRHVLYG